MKLKLRRRAANVMKGLAAGAGELGYTTAIGTFDGFDVAYRTGTADESVLEHSFEKDIFYAGMSYRPATDHTIIDVGAHIGSFALMSARHASAGRVLAVEASQESFNYLKINAALNGFSHLTPVHAALTDKRGTTRLFHDRKNWGHSVMAPLSTQGEEVATLSLADLMADHRLDRVDLIKFNCEGAELPILMASDRALLARVERMLILFHMDLATGYSRDALEAHLMAAGFSLTVSQVELGGQRGWLWAAR